MNLALAAVSYNVLKEERTQQNDGREVRGATLLTALGARKNYPYVSVHVRWSPDHDRTLFVLSVTATSFTARGQGGSALDLSDSRIGAGSRHPSHASKTSLRW